MNKLKRKEVRQVNTIISFVSSFAEEKEEDLIPPAPYSEDEQRSIREPEDLLNPLFMSPTVVYTSGGDQQGDEAH